MIGRQAVRFALGRRDVTSSRRLGTGADSPSDGRTITLPALRYFAIALIAASSPRGSSTYTVRRSSPDDSSTVKPLNVIYAALLTAPSASRSLLLKIVFTSHARWSLPKISTLLVPSANTIPPDTGSPSGNVSPQLLLADGVCSNGVAHTSASATSQSALATACSIMRRRLLVVVSITMMLQLSTDIALTPAKALGAFCFRFRTLSAFVTHASRPDAWTPFASSK